MADFVWSPGVTPLSRDELLAIVRAEEDGIQQDTVETVLVFDQTGRRLLSKRGEHDRVQLTGDEHAQMSGAIVTHNHPTAGRIRRLILAAPATRSHYRMSPSESQAGRPKSAW